MDDELESAMYHLAEQLEELTTLLRTIFKVKQELWK
jgi:hypothetical protein